MTVGTRRLLVDREVCIGAGNCVRLAEDVFDQDDDGRVVVNEPVDLDDAADRIDEAAEACPVAAITFES